MEQHLKIIGELYVEVSNARNIIQQMQAQSQQTAQKMAELQEQVNALENELSKSRTTIQQFKAAAGQTKENETESSK